MYYCKKCKLLNEDMTCKKCGKSQLPLPQPDDICFFVTLYYTHATMFEEALKSRNIPVFSVPHGFSFRMRSSDDRSIYVPYEFFFEANEVYKSIFFRSDEADSADEAEESDTTDATEEAKPTDNADSNKDDNDKN